MVLLLLFVVFFCRLEWDTGKQKKKKSRDAMMPFFSASHKRHLIGVYVYVYVKWYIYIMYACMKYHKHPMPRAECKNISCRHGASYLNYFSITISCIAWLHLFVFFLLLFSVVVSLSSLIIA